MKRRIFSLLYGVVCYLACLGTILYAIGFVGNLILPNTIDSQPQTSLPRAILVNASLPLVFALLPIIKSKPPFTRWWTKFVPEPLERSTLVLLCSICTLLMMWQWQPVGGIVWSIENEPIKTILFITYTTGWGIIFTSTFLVNHFDLFGLRQTWLYFLDKPYTKIPFRSPLFYRLVSDPLYLGFLFMFWSASTMTVAHLLFALLITAYILKAIHFEDKYLVNHFGKKTLFIKRRQPLPLPSQK